MQAASAAAAAAIAAANASFVDEDYEMALQGYSVALKADPENADAFAKRAAAQLKLKRYTEAASDATAAVKLQARTRAHIASRRLREKQLAAAEAAAHAREQGVHAAEHAANAARMAVARAERASTNRISTRADELKEVEHEERSSSQR